MVCNLRVHVLIQNLHCHEFCCLHDCAAVLHTSSGSLQQSVGQADVSTPISVSNVNWLSLQLDAAGCVGTDWVQCIPEHVYFSNLSDYDDGLVRTWHNALAYLGNARDGSLQKLAEAFPYAKERLTSRQFPYTPREASLLDKGTRDLCYISHACRLIHHSFAMWMNQVILCIERNRSLPTCRSKFEQALIVFQRS